MHLIILCMHTGSMYIYGLHRHVCIPKVSAKYFTIISEVLKQLLLILATITALIISKKLVISEQSGNLD